MAKFKYIAIDQLGKSVSGEVEARDQIAAKKQVRAEGLTPLKFTEGGGEESKFVKKQPRQFPLARMILPGRSRVVSSVQLARKLGLSL